MICLMVITDGRKDYMTRTLASAGDKLVGPITRKVIYDDSGDDGYRHWLARNFPDFDLVIHPAGRQGFGGAIHTAWRYLVGIEVDEPFVFHLEQDFTFNRHVDLQDMAFVLDCQPHIVQLALRRQPWNDAERKAGGIVEQWPDLYTDRMDVLGNRWMEHRLFFTTNPSLYRTSLCRRGWPVVGRSEEAFTTELLGDRTARFAFWGRRQDGPWVEHIGEDRVGTGY